jgi:hypothetical protein
VAWDAARAFVRMAGGPAHDAFAGHVLHHLGDEMYGELAGTRLRLLQASVRSSGDNSSTRDIEAARWRVRLEDLLRTDPALVTPLRELTEAAAR